LRYHTTEFLKSLSNDIYHNVTDEIAETINVSKAIDNDSFVIDVLQNEDPADPDEVGKALSAYTSGMCEGLSFSNVFIASTIDGRYYTLNGYYRDIDKNRYPEDSWYDSFVDLEVPYYVNISKKLIDDDPDHQSVWEVRVDSRIESTDGVLLGVCGIELELADLQDIIREYEDEYDIEVIFVDSDGNYKLDSSDAPDYENKSLSLPEIADGEDVAYVKAGNLVDYNLTQYIDTLDWYMIIRDINPYSYMYDFVLVAVNIATYILLLVITLVSFRYITANADTLHADSYLDKLTGMYNRRAYEDKVNTLRNADSLSNITVIMFDVNGLKQTNDTHGHMAGDSMITGCAGIIRKYFDPYGKCYRTGGDEFVAILDKPVDFMDVLMERFERALDDWEADCVEELSVSYGIARTNDDNTTIDEMIFLADEQMYVKKKEHYSAAERDRRKMK
jgi:diguanylate cyclase (GGDEF)-like protein